MKFVEKYVYPRSTREAIAGLRHYTVDGQEEKLPSVTTVLGQTQPKEKRESLDRWRQKVGLREAEKITRDAAIRGTAMHKPSTKIRSALLTLNKRTNRNKESGSGIIFYKWVLMVWPMMRYMVPQ